MAELLVPATGLQAKKLPVPALYFDLLAWVMAEECSGERELPVFVFGERFKSFGELERKLKSFEDSKFTKFWKREARIIEAARKRTDRHIQPSLKYYQLKYACIHGGQSFRPKGKGIKSTS